jgi:hypothetical protein
MMFFYVSSKHWHLLMGVRSAKTQKYIIITTTTTSIKTSDLIATCMLPVMSPVGLEQPPPPLAASLVECLPVGGETAYTEF